MTILGLDPGSRWTGFAILRVKNGRMEHLDSGVIDLRGGVELASRLGQLARDLGHLMEKWNPHHVAVENVFLGKNPSSAFILGQARGVCLAMASQYGADVFEYATRSVKKSVTGRGGSEKEEVRLILEAELGCRFPSLDQSDSVALAFCHGRQLQVKAVIEKGQKGVEL